MGTALMVGAFLLTPAGGKNTIYGAVALAWVPSPQEGDSPSRQTHSPFRLSAAEALASAGAFSIDRSKGT